jgi:hypothetical protein
MLTFAITQRNVSALEAAASKKIKNVFEEHANPGKSKGMSQLLM